MARVEPLETPVEPPSPAAGRPSQAPQTFAAPDAAPLATLVPRVGTVRDPAEPFDTDSAAFRGDTAWGQDADGTGWVPTQPLGTATATLDPFDRTVDPYAPDAVMQPMAFPPPTETRFAPPVGVPVVPEPQYPGIAPQIPPYPTQPYPAQQFPPQPFPTQQFPTPPYPGAQFPYQPPFQQPWPVAPQPRVRRFTGLDALMLAALVIGLVARPLSVAAIAAAWLIARSQGPRRRGIRRTLLGGLITAVVLGMLDILGEDESMRTWGEFNVFGWLECLVLLVVVGVQLLVQRRP